MEGLMQGLADVWRSIYTITTPEGWGFTALGFTCVSMMWYFNSAGHQQRVAKAIAEHTEERRLLDLSQQTIAEAFETLNQKGILNTKDKEAMYTMLYKSNPKMKEFKPESKEDSKISIATNLIGVGAKLRTKWPFRSKADEARADLASLVSSINAAKK